MYVLYSNVVGQGSRGRTCLGARSSLTSMEASARSQFLSPRHTRTSMSSSRIGSRSSRPPFLYVHPPHSFVAAITVWRCLTCQSAVHSHSRRACNTWSSLSAAACPGGHITSSRPGPHSPSPRLVPPMRSPCFFSDWSCTTGRMRIVSGKCPSLREARWQIPDVVLVHRILYRL